MRRGRLLAEARRGVEGLVVKKDNRNKGSSTAFQRFKCCYVASECEEKVQGLEEKMGSLRTEVQGLRVEVSAMHKVAPAWWSNAEKQFLQESFKKKLASLQEEVKGVRADTTAFRADFNSHVEFMSVGLIERLRMDSDAVKVVSAELEKKITELSDRMARIDGYMQADMSLLGTIEKKMDSMQEEMTGLRADVASHAKSDASLAVMFNTRIEYLRGQLFISMQEEMTGLKTEVEKVLGYVRRLDPVIATIGSMDRLHVEMIALDNRLRELQEMHTHAAMRHAKEMENFQTDLSKRMCEAVKHLYVDMAPQFSALEGDANTGKVQMVLLNKMHAEMARFSSIIGNVIAQEQGIMKIQILVDTLLSNLESYTTDKERANIILVKIVSVFLACTTAFYAWIVWSFNSCYPL